VTTGGEFQLQMTGLVSVPQGVNEGQKIFSLFLSKKSFFSHSFYKYLSQFSQFKPQKIFSHFL